MMSRSGYSDDIEDCLEFGRWRGQVASALKGARGQSFLREMVATLDAMPEKKLAQSAWVENDGCACALGAVAVARGVSDKLMDLDPDDPSAVKWVAAILGIAYPMAAQIVFMNDEGTWKSESPEERWRRMRDWAQRKITKEPAQ